MKTHISYIDGLKGFCSLLVVLLHYLMGYVGTGYVGWESNIAHDNKLEYFWANFPLSGILNSTFILQIFFTIVAFLPAWHFFNQNDVQWVKKQAITRYFRFMPYVVSIVIVSYIIYLSGGYFNNEVGDLLGIKWMNALMAGNLSWPDAFITAFFKSFWQGNSSYVAVLWCMHIIFLGSYVAYASILLFASSKKHLYIYFVLLCISSVTISWATVFIGGVMIASIANAELKNPSNAKFRQRVGLSLFIVGMILGICVDGISNDFRVQDTIKNFAALLVTLSIFYLDFLQKIFQNPFLIRCGHYSFSLILTHCLVMLSISAWIFIKFHAWFGYNLALWFTFIISILPLFLATVIFAKVIDPIGVYISNKVYKTLK